MSNLLPQNLGTFFEIYRSATGLICIHGFIDNDCQMRHCVIDSVLHKRWVLSKGDCCLSKLFADRTLMADGCKSLKKIRNPREQNYTL